MRRFRSLALLCASLLLCAAAHADIATYDISFTAFDPYNAASPTLTGSFTITLDPTATYTFGAYPGLTVNNLGGTSVRSKWLQL